MMTRVHCTRRCSTGQTWSTVDARHSKGREEGARTIIAPQLVAYPPERSGLDSGSLPWRIDERRERRGGESRLVVVRTHAERVIAGRDRRERACDELYGSSASLPRVHVVWRPRRRSACASAGRGGEAG